MNKISSYVFIFCSIIILISGTFYYPKWKAERSEAQISWDAGGYYWYLPSLFIYEDIKEQKFKDKILHQYYPIPEYDFQYGFLVENGNYVMKYTVGMALVESPAFFVAHQYAKNSSKYEADGFSRPYQVSVYISGLLIGLIGLFYFRKVLLRYYSDKISALTLLILVLGTNYLNYAGIEVGMTHTWLFTFNTLILFCTIRFYDSFQNKYIYLLALFLGLATLIRPTEIVSILIPILWALPNMKWSSIRDRFLLFWNHISSLIIASLLFLSIVSLQFIYWKYASGHFFVYSYGDQGFNWLAPVVKLYAFNYQSGWLTYTPMMLLILPAVPYFIFKGKNRWAILTYALITYYIVTAWALWDIGGRAMIQSYPVLMFIISQLLQDIMKVKFLKYLSFVFILFGMTYNFWWTYQAHTGNVLKSIPSNEAYYWKTLFRNNIPSQYQFLRDHPEIYEGEINEEHLLIHDRWENPITVKGSNDFHRLYDVSRIIKQDWIRVYADVAIEDKEWDVWRMSVLMVKVLNQGETVKVGHVRFQRLLNNFDKRELHFDLQYDGDFDQIDIHLYNDQESQHPLFLKGLKIIHFRG